MSLADDIRERARRKALALREEGPAPVLSDRAREAVASLSVERGRPIEEVRGVVRETPEFLRVDGLPSVPWAERGDVDELVAAIIEGYRRQGSTMVPFPQQAAALSELAHVGGLFCPLPVGSGKTLISYLAGAVLDVDRILVLVPAALREKTHRDFDELSKHWRVRGEILVESYERLSRSTSATLIEDFAPDLIVADECHKLRNLQAACTRRVVRYGVERRGECAFVMLSGTITKRRLADFHHLIGLTLGPDAMPLPTSLSETSVWGRAVDEKVMTRSHPGVLRRWADGSNSLDDIRAAVGRRICNAPGVISMSTTQLEASILIDFFDAELSKTQRQLIRQVTREKIAPNGDECTPADVVRHVRTLVQGFYYVWDPEPPEPWLKARSSWKRFARQILETEDPRFDSELQVWNACLRGELPDKAALAWQRVRDSFRPNTVAVWVDDDVVTQLIERTREVLFVEHIAVGQRIAQRTGWPYYHSQGLAADGSFIDDHRDGPMVASIAANATGRNLQRWRHAVVAPPPSSGDVVEQLIGRLHRHGQQADEVEFLFMLGHPVLAQAMRQAFADARYQHRVMRQPQKLLLADSTREFD